MYEELVTALQMCGYPESVYYCGHGCPFAKNGATCEMSPLLSASVNAIKYMNETLHDYRTAVERINKV